MALLSRVALLLIATCETWCACGLSRWSVAADNSSNISVEALSIDPIYYLHLPDSGSGLASTIAHHACFDRIPTDVTVLDPSKFVKDYAEECNSSNFMKFTSWHDPLTDVSESGLHHVATMFREPNQRILSGYYNDLHQCGDIQRKYNCIAFADGKMKCDGDIKTANGTYIRNHEVIPPAEYAGCVENCTTNMLTGTACANVGSARTERAVEIVSKLGFVGLEHEWALSVCLWHRKFGGWILPAELSNNHRGVVASSTGGVTAYDERTLLGFWHAKAEADKRVFKAAATRFWKEIDEYKVKLDECEEKAMNLSRYGN
jgi:hypothetical protein